MNTPSEKKELRQLYRALREQCPTSTREHFDQIATSSILALPEYIKASTLLLFYPFGSEPNVLLIARHALAEGKQIAFPRCISHTSMEFCLVPSLSTDCFIQTQPYGILEPQSDIPSYNPQPNDLCIVPGLAFDQYHYRLGYGAGYYDRYLQAHPMHTVSIVYPFQKVEGLLPINEYDLPVDTLIEIH